MSDTPLLPPHSLEAETEILGAMLFNPSEIPKAVDRLGSAEDGKRFFYVEKHGTIYAAIVELYKQGRTEQMMVHLIDYLGDKLKEIGGPSYLTTLGEQYIGVLPDTTLDLLMKKERERVRYMTAGMIKQKLLERQERGEEAVDFLTETATIMRDDLYYDHPDKRGVNTVLKEVIAEWTARIKSGGLLGKASHIPRLDGFTGGWARDRLIVVGGRPGMGKTSVCLEFGDKIVREGGHVCFISLEMSDVDLLGRVICQRAKAVYSKLQVDPKAFNADSDWDAVEKAFGDLKDSGWSIVDRPGMDIHQVCAAIENEHNQRPLDLAVIDYLQLISGLSEDYRAQAVADACMYLKNVARRLNVPIILISQLSRALEQRKADKRPTQADLRDSGGIEQAADQVIFCYRDYVYNKKLQGKARMVAEIIIAKNRFGPCGTVYCFFDGPTTRFFQDDYTLAEIVLDDEYPALTKEWLGRERLIDPASGNITIKPLEYEEDAFKRTPLPGDSEDLKNAEAEKPKKSEYDELGEGLDDPFDM